MTSSDANVMLIPSTKGVRWSRIAALIVVAAALGVGVATILGLAPWLFLALFGLAGTYIAGVRLGWARAAWSSVVVALFSASWILVVDPYVDARLDVATVVVLSVALVAGLIALWRFNRVHPRPLPPVLETVTLLLPAVASGAYFYGVSLLRGMPLGWAMQGDAQFNTVLSRQVGLANGQTLEGGVLSLAQGLMAIVHLPGRAVVPADDLLLHDVSRQANLWILVILLSSVLAGSIAYHVLKDVPRPLRLFGILASSVLPLTWHLTGYAMSSGFYNVSIAFLTIELAFYLWLAIPSPLWRSSALLALTIVMLGAWTPMAVIPAALAGWAALQALAARQTRAAVVVWIVAALQLAVFAALFILPGFLAKSAVLSVSGSILPLNRNLYFAITVAALLVAALAGTRHRDAAHHVEPLTSARHFAVGVAVIAVSAGLGTGFLIFQNRHLPDYWTYYPVKFAWISMEVLVLLIFLGSVLLASTMRGQRLVSAASVVGVTLVLVSLMQLNPPQQGGLTSAFPILAVAKNDSPADATLPLLTNVSGDKVFFFRYSTLEQDTFMNQWQFQITAKDEFTPIRNFAYTAVSSFADVCDAARAWDGGVTVITTKPFTADVLNDRCGTLLTAVVGQPLG